MATRHSHGTMKGAFGHAHFYDGFTRPFRRFYARVAAEVAAAGLAPGARVLDVGTGPGRLPLLIAGAAPGLRVEGLDLSPEMIGHARRRAREAGMGDRVTFVVGDVADLAYPDDTFDLVVSTMSHHHWPDAAAGLRELRRVVRPGAQVWIYDFRFPLRRAEAAARAAFPDHDVRSEPVRPGWPLWLLGRVVVRAA